MTFDASKYEKFVAPSGSATPPTGNTTQGTSGTVTPPPVKFNFNIPATKGVQSTPTQTAPTQIQGARPQVKFDFTKYVNDPAKLAIDQKSGVLDKAKFDVARNLNIPVENVKSGDPVFMKALAENAQKNQISTTQAVVGGTLGTIGSVAKAAWNFPGSVYKLGEGIAGFGKEIMTPPFMREEGEPSPAEGMLNVIEGAVQKLVPGEQDKEKYVDEIKNAFLNRYGGWDKATKTFEEDPAGALYDIAMILEGGGALFKGLGATTKVNLLSEVGKGLSGAATKVEPLSTAINLSAKATKKTADSFMRILPTEANDIRKTQESLKEISNGNQKIRKFVDSEGRKGNDVEANLAKTGILNNVIDENGVIRTKQPGGALDQYKEFLEPAEGIVTKELEREGKVVKISDVEKKLIDDINNSTEIAGSAKTDALNAAKQEINGLLLDADEAGNIPLAKIHQAKVSAYKRINYIDPKVGTTDKGIAKSLKEFVEEGSSAEIKEINKELAKHRANIELLEKLDGARVKGGRAGIYTAKILGAVSGSIFGAPGAVIGAELAGKLQEKILKSRFGNIKNPNVEIDKKLLDVIEKNKASQSPNATSMSQSPTNITNAPPSPIMEPTVSQPETKVKQNVQNPTETPVTTAKTESLAKTPKEEYSGVMKEKPVASDLREEAKKYKSADEFVKNISNVFHGGEIIDNIKLGKSKYGKIFFVTEDPKYAELYSKKSGGVNELSIDKNASLIDIKNADITTIDKVRNAINIELQKTKKLHPDKQFTFYPYSEKEIIEGAIRGKSHFAEHPSMIKIYKKLGYDGLVSYEDAGGAKNIGIWNTNKIKTKQQLIDIWNEANKK